MKTKIIWPLAFCIAISLFAQAQKALDATGGRLAGNNMVVEYSLGETLTATIGNLNDKYCTAGVIQPYYLTATPAEEHFGDNFYLKVFPNPASYQVNIETNLSDFRWLRLTNTAGQALNEMAFAYAPLDLSWLAAGTYFLTLTSKDEQISKTIKIVKQ